MTLQNKPDLVILKEYNSFNECANVKCVNLEDMEELETIELDDFPKIIINNDIEANKNNDLIKKDEKSCRYKFSIVYSLFLFFGGLVVLIILIILSEYGILNY